MTEFIVWRGDGEKPRCKMSIFIEEYDEESSYCGISTRVKCEGLLTDRNNCPYWRKT